MKKKVLERDKSLLMEHKEPIIEHKNRTTNLVEVQISYVKNGYFYNANHGGQVKWVYSISMKIIIILI